MKDIFDQALERICPDCKQKVVNCDCEDPKWLSEPERTWLKSFRAGCDSGHFEEIARGAYCDVCGTILFEGRYYQCDCYGRRGMEKEVTYHGQIPKQKKFTIEEMKKKAEDHLKVVMDHTLINKMEGTLLDEVNTKLEKLLDASTPGPLLTGDGLKKREADSSTLCPSCVYEYSCPMEKTITHSAINCTLFEYSGKESVSNESKDVNEYKVIEDIVEWYKKNRPEEESNFMYRVAVQEIGAILKYYGIIE